MLEFGEFIIHFSGNIVLTLDLFGALGLGDLLVLRILFSHLGQRVQVLGTGIVCSGHCY